MSVIVDVSPMGVLMLLSGATGCRTTSSSVLMGAGNGRSSVVVPPVNVLILGRSS